MKNKKGIRAGIAIILIISIFYIFDYMSGKRLNDNYRITIAQVTKLEWPSNGQESAKIFYYYKGKDYHGSFSILMGYEGKFEKGSRVFIKFSPENPDFAEVQHEYNVPDTLSAPEDGWKELPVKIRRVFL